MLELPWYADLFLPHGHHKKTSHGHHIIASKSLMTAFAVDQAIRWTRTKKKTARVPFGSGRAVTLAVSGGAPRRPLMHRFAGALTSEQHPTAIGRHVVRVELFV